MPRPRRPDRSLCADTSRTARSSSRSATPGQGMTEDERARLFERFSQQRPAGRGHRHRPLHLAPHRRAPRRTDPRRHHRAARHDDARDLPAVPPATTRPQPWRGAPAAPPSTSAAGDGARSSSSSTTNRRCATSSPSPWRPRTSARSRSDRPRPRGRSSRSARRPRRSRRHAPWHVRRRAVPAHHSSPDVPCHPAHGPRRDARSASRTRGRCRRLRRQTLPSPRTGPARVGLVRRTPRGDRTIAQADRSRSTCGRPRRMSRADGSTSRRTSTGRCRVRRASRRGPAVPTAAAARLGRPDLLGGRELLKPAIYDCA